MELLPSVEKRVTEEDELDHRHDGIGPGDTIERQHKLVAANAGQVLSFHAGDHVGGASQSLESMGQADQELIADWMSQTVVDHLEAIQVHKKQGKVVVGIPLGTSAAIGDTFQQKGPIGKARQTVVEGVVAQLLFGGSPHGNFILELERSGFHHLLELIQLELGQLRQMPLLGLAPTSI